MITLCMALVDGLTSFDGSYIYIGTLVIDFVWFLTDEPSDTGCPRHDD